MFFFKCITSLIYSHSHGRPKVLILKLVYGPDPFWLTKDTSNVYEVRGVSVVAVNILLLIATILESIILPDPVKK